MNAARWLGRIIVPSRLRARGDESGMSPDATVLARRLGEGRVLAGQTQRMIVNHVRSAGSAGASGGRGRFTRAGILANALLASDFGHSMETWLTTTFNESVPSIYDKAADAVYLATNIGGAQLHRLYDGSHTFWGMWA